MRKLRWWPPVLWAGALALAMFGGVTLGALIPRPAEDFEEEVSNAAPRPEVHSAADVVEQMEERARIAAEAERQLELDVPALVDEQPRAEDVEEISEDDQRSLAENFLSATIAAPAELATEKDREELDAELERSEEASARLIAAAVRGQRSDDLEAGQTLILQREYRAARNVLLDCVAGDPTSAECHKLLGTAYAKLDQPDLAATHYRQFLKFAPADHPQYGRVEDVLAAYDKNP